MEEAKDPLAKQDPGQITFLDLVLVLAENLRLLIVVTLVAGLAALGISYLIPPVYTSTTSILPPAQQQGISAVLGAQLGPLAGLGVGVGGIKNPTDQYAGLLRSRSVLDAMVQKFQLKQLYNERYNVDARNELDKRTKITTTSRDGLIVIEVEDRDPKRAADMANGYVEELRNLSKTLAIGEAAQRRLFFELQLTQAKDSLTKSEIALRSSAVSETTLRTVPQSALDALARLKAQITTQEIKLSSMRMFMTDSNPDLKVSVQELAALRGELLKAEQGNSPKATGEGAEYIAKYRDFKYYEALFELMAKQYELARIDEAREGAVVQVVDAAQPPERRSRPRRTLIAVLTAVTAFFGTVLLVLIRRRLKSISMEEESARKIGRILQLLGLRRT